MKQSSTIDVEQTESNERFLPALALALVDRPRATLQELAALIHVSKATLYRFCPSRDQLIERVVSHASLCYRMAIENSRLDEDAPSAALSRLIRSHLLDREFMIFLHYNWRPEYLDAAHHDKNWLNGVKALDAFFLRGQNEGTFRIDVSAAAMTELFYNILAGLMDAERRGRVPRNDLVHLIELSITNCVCKK